ncbi:hypothetical protein NNJEOMEG_02168 [Fundidesulfovibrio magnetotacticus]|uniref:MlaB-like STAS domain-containing protein n=1 Tax=Fundidesulfovibrio magnetotacticus TaxID=2730080 RepID=A0A6V8M1J9_9BACT|nr:STAS domain-containing protein [Fundidesulfovibrio magnetotacticus]GFK94325.1 hypothetical protein NNJEOMEG_02168 [Fundidesulfovibrio magnetotacticus]
MGQHEFQSGADGEGLLLLSGEFNLADGGGLKAALQDALGRAPARLTLDLRQVAQPGLPFFQLLFALAAQARKVKRRVSLKGPLPEQFLSAAGALGISLVDFEQTFDLE